MNWSRGGRDAAPRPGPNWVTRPSQITARAKGERMSSDITTVPVPVGGGTIHVLLAGPDTMYFSCDIIISDAMRERLTKEKEAAQVAAKAGQVHCPEWLGAHIMPTGAKGGYGLLVETEDFTVKLLGPNIPNRPGLYLELRSHFLHVHPDGPAGACEAALAWVRENLFADQDAWLVERAISFKAAKLSRADLHIDWQGGYAPSLTNVAEDLRRFIRPGKTKWGFFGEGHSPTGYTFGKGDIQARIYNKTREVTEKSNDAYFALLVARAGDRWDPNQDVWRLEFELKRDGAKGFRLYSPLDVDDEDAILEAELSAEELEHIGTLPRFFARMGELFAHLSQHWLRLVVDTGSTNRSRWPLDPTWQQLRKLFPVLAAQQTCEPLEDDGWPRTGAGFALQRAAAHPAAHGAGVGEILRSRGCVAGLGGARRARAVVSAVAREGGGASASASLLLHRETGTRATLGGARHGSTTGTGPADAPSGADALGGRECPRRAAAGIQACTDRRRSGGAASRRPGAGSRGERRCPCSAPASLCQAVSCRLAIGRLERTGQAPC